MRRLVLPVPEEPWYREATDFMRELGDPFSMPLMLCQAIEGRASGDFEGNCIFEYLGDDLSVALDGYAQRNNILSEEAYLGLMDTKQQNLLGVYQNMLSFYEPLYDLMKLDGNDYLSIDSVSNNVAIIKVARRTTA